MTAFDRPTAWLTDWLPEIIGWRQDFHRHPELLFDLPRTAGRVAQLLRSFGCDSVVEGIGRSGVVGVIQGARQASGQSSGQSPGRVIGLRADMDALPIMERTGREYTSTVPGKMHACGHDGHMSMLLAAAKYLAATRDFDGTVVVIFQPAEEGGGGGREMVQDGLMDRFAIQEVYGMHNMPGLPVGQFCIRPGAMMAAADQFEITVTGKGGHAARPQDGVDTMLVAAHIVVAAQSIISRNTDPMAQAVLSICTMSGDSTAHNVIPQVVKMRGTVRSLDPAVQDRVERRLNDLVTGTAQAFGATGMLDYRRGYPVTVNALAQTGYAADVARRVAAGPVDAETVPQMWAEDFSFMLNARPGAYIFTGNGDSAALHHPEYDFNDAALPFGAAWYIGMAEARLAP
ncbi:amidohydrolase [Gemmobacter serpentinus]|uniref:amidohydrolase n=1 Tax=Gemmobacter serpentinus TaxID=2652247 RepID=UPI00124C241C|nr:amidohydrolase [Gemmobacter serpentinus]